MQHLIFKANECQISNNKSTNERQVILPIYNLFDIYNFCKNCMNIFLDTKTLFLF